MHKVQVQTGNHTHFWRMIMDDIYAKAKKNGSEIIQRVAKSSDVLCIFGILWTKGRTLVQRVKY